MTSRRDLIRVAWVHPVLPHYRVPVVNRLAKQPGLHLENFAGQPKLGVSVDSAAAGAEPRVWPLHNVRTPGNDPRVLYAVGWSRILRRGFDVVITTEASHNVINWLLLSLRRLFGFRLLIMGHIRLDSETGRIGRSLRRLLVTAADGVIAYTSEGALQAEAWGVAKRAITVMGNTLDVSAIREARKGVKAAELPGLRAKFSASGMVLLFVGRPTAPKLPEVAIDTMLLLEKRGVDAKLLFIGASLEQSALKARARSSSSVHFLGAVFDEAALATYFALADAVFIPGAVGLSVVHAFAYGRPLLTSLHAPHRPEMACARNGVNTLFATTGSPSEFADIIQGLAVKPADLERLKSGAEATELNSAELMATAIAEAVRGAANA